MKRSYLLLILFVCGSMSLSAQTKSEVQLGLATPSGDFADDDADDAIFEGSGVAANGFYLGYKAITPLSEKNLFWTFSAGLMCNGLNSDFTDDLEDGIKDEDEYDGNYDAKYSKYLNIPILVGLQYETELSPSAKVFGEFGVGLNVFKMTNMTVSYDYYSNYNSESYNLESSYEFKPSIKMGYKIGGGIVLKDKYSIGLTYMGLGSHKVKYTYKEKMDGDTDKEDGKFDSALPISNLNFVFGLRF